MVGIGRTEVDTEKEQEFIDQWIMLLVERSALLQPKPGSGVPGAPIRWEMSPGMEPCVTTLYLDLNGMLLGEMHGILGQVWCYDRCMYALTDDDLHTDAIIIITYTSQCTSNIAAT